MMDAKKALTETDGDMEAAVDWLRTKGLAKAAKKSGRTAAEGLVAVGVKNGRGIVVEVNAETDFVAKNSDFQGMVGRIAQAALVVNTLEELRTHSHDGMSIEALITASIAKIGENMTLRRMATLHGETVVSYVHNAATDGMGKIGVLVALTGTDNGIGKQIAMHVAAANPVALSGAEMDPALVEKERSFQTQKRMEDNATAEKPKPQAVLEKIVENAVNKFISDSTLLGQAFVVNPDLTVAQAAKEAGVTITGFVRLEVGEGIDKVVEDFAAEVAKVVQG
jgi:elongation factor Ts